MLNSSECKTKFTWPPPVKSGKVPGGLTILPLPSLLKSNSTVILYLSLLVGLPTGTGDKLGVCLTYNHPLLWVAVFIVKLTDAVAALYSIIPELGKNCQSSGKVPERFGSEKSSFVVISAEALPGKPAVKSLIQV